MSGIEMSDATHAFERHKDIAEPMLKLANTQLPGWSLAEWQNFCNSIDRITAERDALYEALVALVAHTDGAFLNDEKNEAIFAAARAAIASTETVTEGNP